MNIELIPETGSFYKVNMHCHTTLSDGKQTPEEVKQKYMEHGYNAVAFTDHEILLDHRDLCDENFVALHGYEVAFNAPSNGRGFNFCPVYHLNLIAKDQNNLLMPRFFKNRTPYYGKTREWVDEHAQYSSTIDGYKYSIDWLNDYTKAVTEAGFLVNYNHPQWSLHDCRDYLGLEHIHSLELINGGCILHSENTSIHYAEMLRNGMRVVPTAGDDNHSSYEFAWGWTMIKAPELTYDALIAAYERGDCYASCGPEIKSLVLKDGRIHVKSSEAAAIILLSEGRFVTYRWDGGKPITEAEFDYRPDLFGKFFRIEVRDQYGRKAFSNAYYTEEIDKQLNQ